MSAVERYLSGGLADNDMILAACRRFATRIFDKHKRNRKERRNRSDRRLWKRRLGKP